MNGWTVLVLVIVFNAVTSLASEFELEIATSSDYDDWEIDADEVKRFTVTEGTSTRLKCLDNSYEQTNVTNVTWTYMRCKLTECSGKGMPICGTSCKPWLKLDKIKLNESGLYSCYGTSAPPIPGYTLEAFHLSSYHITVLKDDLKTEPVFLESPKPLVKVMSSSKLSLSCKIKSSGPALVRWFKQVPLTMISDQPKNPSHIVYQNKTYQPLDLHPFEKRGSEFSGKLIINKTKSTDGGNYVCCIVTSQYGIQLRESRVLITPYIARHDRIKEQEEIIYEWSQSEKIWTGAALAVVVLVSCGWTAACCCVRFNSTTARASTRTTARETRRRNPPPVTSDTSDYEHV